MRTKPLNENLNKAGGLLKQDTSTKGNPELIH